MGLLSLRVAECQNKHHHHHLYNRVNGEYPTINCRKHSAVLTDFGAVGDGKTLNTKAFNVAIQNLSRYASDGGAQLIVPPGKWLTGSFNLTSHFTLFLHKDAVILGTQACFLFLFFLFYLRFNLFLDLVEFLGLKWFMVKIIWNNRSVKFNLIK